jgi:DNA-binding transcriptional MerR regulator
VTSVAIPNRPVFRAQEVCELAELQPYVLRTWEAEFPDLGVTKGAGSRVYRRADVERVLRIKHLLFVDGLTLAGARKRLSEEGLVRTEEPVIDSDVAALIDGETRQQLRDVRRGLQWILAVLGSDGQPVPDFVAHADAAPRRASKPAAAKAKAAAAKSVKKGPAKRGRR